MTAWPLLPMHSNSYFHLKRSPSRMSWTYCLTHWVTHGCSSSLVIQRAPTVCAQRELPPNRRSPKSTSLAASVSLFLLSKLRPSRRSFHLQACRQLIPPRVFLHNSTNTGSASPPSPCLSQGILLDFAHLVRDNRTMELRLYQLIADCDDWLVDCRWYCGSGDPPRIPANAHLRGLCY